MINQEHIWLNSHKSKAHLSPHCAFCNPDAIRKASNLYPDGHLEYCTHCLNYYDRWISGFETPYDTNGCNRCGKSTDGELCETCHQKVILKR